MTGNQSTDILKTNYHSLFYKNDYTCSFYMFDKQHENQAYFDLML